MAAATITMTVGLLWSDPGGDQIKGTVVSRITQVGSVAIGNVQLIGATTESIDLGDVTGDKYLMFENRETSVASGGTGQIIYIDPSGTATTSSPIKLGPGEGTTFRTAGNTWSAISSASTSHLGVTAMPV